jgi:hypothetical protein
MDTEKLDIITAVDAVSQVARRGMLGSQTVNTAPGWCMDLAANAIFVAKLALEKAEAALKDGAVVPHPQPRHLLAEQVAEVSVLATRFAG